jgi:DNA-directed RNA polymerase subunit RPC12/RpoP
MEISMEKPREKCPQCGKKVKFLKKHIKRTHLSRENPGKFPEKVQEISREKSRKISREKVQEISREKSREKVENSSVLKEIKLLEVYNSMTETINPKKDEKKEPAYKCGGCGGTFEEKYKRCPHCGVEF